MYYVSGELYCFLPLVLQLCSAKNKLDAAYCSHSYLVKHWKAQQFWAQVFDDAGMCQSNLFYSSVAYFSLPERNNIKK